MGRGPPGRLGCRATAPVASTARLRSIARALSARTTSATRSSSCAAGSGGGASCSESTTSERPARAPGRARSDLLEARPKSGRISREHRAAASPRRRPRPALRRRAGPAAGRRSDAGPRCQRALEHALRAHLAGEVERRHSGPRGPHRRSRVRAPISRSPRRRRARSSPAGGRRRQAPDRGTGSRSARCPGPAPARSGVDPRDQRLRATSAPRAAR